MDVDGTAAIVTGGASGLGEATARALAAKGASVTIADLQDDKGESLVGELGGGARYVHCDVTDADQVATAVGLAGEDAPLRVCVNCAGIGWAERTINRDGQPANIEAFRTVLEINVVGTYQMLGHAAGAMSRTEPLEHGERGVIVNTASVAAFEGQIGQAAYSASKGAIAGLTVPVARDLSSIGVRLCTIAPGILNTPMLAGVTDEVRANLAAGVPFPKRIGEPAEFGQLVLSIVDNGYLNGEVIRLDGLLRMQPK